MFLGIVIFLIVLAVFDLVVGVSNDAVNFLNSAIGSKVARFKTIVIVASIGVFVGAAMSNGMMDVARHGILTPHYFSFYDVICVFLAVMVTDVVLLDIYNTLGMPTSTTVSMVFELLGGAFAVALLKIMNDAVGPDGVLLSLGELLNTEKALSVILGIFLSVPLAFVLGYLVQWIARIIFTFKLVHSPLKIGMFAGLAVISIVWFLLVNGLKGSSLMTPNLRAFINQYTWSILGGGFLCFSLLMSVLSALKLPVLKFVVLLGTFALAMAFAGNDLVNFVGVPLTALDAYNDYQLHGLGNASSFFMTSLMASAQTPPFYLVLAGMVMVLSLIFSKKAQNVVKTSVDLSRQDEGDEMFGSSGVARVLVRSTQHTVNSLQTLVPKKINRWVDERFNADASALPDGAAFDQVRAAVNLVLAGLLVAMGTSMKLPLSTTYVTFMVAMGTSLADRAWSRESAVFRITGVISVIGGWFITAGAAFIMCFFVTNLLYFGSFIAMGISIVLALYLLFRSNISYKKTNKASKADELFNQILHTSDKTECWLLFRQQVGLTTQEGLRFVARYYERLTTAFFYEDYRTLKRSMLKCDDYRKDAKRMRRKQIIALRRVDPVLSVEKGTWYFLVNNSIMQMIYSLKRMGEPCREHVGNNFSPVPDRYATEFIAYRNEVIRIFNRAIESSDYTSIRDDAAQLQAGLSEYRKHIILDIQSQQLNIESMTVFLNLVQESQELLSALRHNLRGYDKFQES